MQGIHLLIRFIEEYICETVQGAFIKRIIQLSLWSWTILRFEMGERQIFLLQIGRKVTVRRRVHYQSDQLQKRVSIKEDLKTDSFITFCDLVPILKSLHTSRASVLSSNNCCLFVWVSKLPRSSQVSYWLTWLGLVTLANLWFPLVF